MIAAIIISIICVIAFYQCLKKLDEARCNAQRDFERHVKANRRLFELEKQISGLDHDTQGGRAEIARRADIWQERTR
jgi:hypothetical protein